MANCSYCGKPAGLFRKVHRECQAKFRNGWAQLVQRIADAIPASAGLDPLRPELQEIARAACISDEQLHQALVVGWERALEHFLGDGNLTAEEESKLTEFMESHSLSREELDVRGAFTRLVKGATLRDVMEGKIPERMRFHGNSPFNLQKDEQMIWVFFDVAYLEDKSYRRYTGGYQGMSFRVARGVYYRFGGFSAQPVDSTQRVHLDSGTVGITTKHIYFAGASKAFRVRFDKIVSFTPYANGVGIQRDAANAKHQVFVTGDGWFAYNLATNVARAHWS